MNRLPEKFKESLRGKLGIEFESFTESLALPPPVSVRINPAKSLLPPLSDAVGWCQYGHYLPSRPIFTLDPLFHAGTYYVQEASSMFLEEALRQSVDLTGSLTVLDLCAAPGGKSTHVLSLLSRESLLVSNEVIRSRASILSENIQKWGYPNAIVTNNDPKDFQGLKSFFDIIIVDAPCSGEGLFRKDPEAIGEWSPENVQLCASRQKRILSDVWDALRENGILIYCTCTYNETENEDNLKWIQETYGVEFVRLKRAEGWGVEEVETNNIFAYRFFPHKTRGEGFFMSVMRKTDAAALKNIKSKKPVLSPVNAVKERLKSWISGEGLRFYQFNDLLFFTPAAREKEVEYLLQHLRIVYAGTNVATLKHDKLIPDLALALSILLQKENFPGVELSEADALQYLRKESIVLNGMAIGFTIVTYKNIPLGWVNVLANRVNNMYPAEWRIRRV